MTEKLSDLVVVTNASDAGWNNNTNEWIISSLAGGSSKTLLLTVKVIANGTLTNAVIGKAKENTTEVPANSTNITAKPLVDVQVTVTVDQSVVDYGSVVEFVITVKNNGPSNATGVYVENVIPEGFVFIADNCTNSDYESIKDKLGSDSSEQSYDKSTNVWTVGNLAVGEENSLSILARADYVGTKAVTSTVSSNEDDSNTTNNKDSASVKVNPLVDLSLVKTVDKTKIKVGDKVTYTFTVTNNGPNDATGVKVTDTAITKHTFVSASSDDYNHKTGVWNIGKLANGSSVTLKVTVKITEEGTYSNFAVVSCNENDTDETNNNASSDDVKVTKKPDKNNTTEKKSSDVKSPVIHATGNPIFMALFVLLTTLFVTLR